MALVMEIFIFAAIFFFLILYIVIAVALKVIKKKNPNSKLYIAGKVLLIAPVVLIVCCIVFSSSFCIVILPNRHLRFVFTGNVNKMNELVDNGSEEAIAELDDLLNHSKNLVHYHDKNLKSVLDHGLEKGNYGIVYTSIEHGAVFDAPIRYENMAYVHNSMEFYLTNIIGRTVTQDDVEIIKLMFSEGASTVLERKPHSYSNMFGLAAWSVLYNDNTVSDTELEFIQVFIDNGISSDNQLTLLENMPSNYIYGSEYHENVKKDNNYYTLMEMLGM